MAKKTIEVKKERFVNFLKLLSLKGDIANKQATLNFEDTNVTAYTIAPANSVATKGTWNANFDSWGEVGLTNIETLSSFIAPLRGTKIFIDIDKNKFKTTSENGKVKSKNILCNTSYILNGLSPEQFKLIKEKASGNDITIPLDVIKEMLTYINSVASKDVTLDIQKDSITLTLQNKQDEIEASFDITTPDTFEPVTLRMPYYFSDVLTLTENDITLSAKDGTPVYIKMVQHDSEFEYLMLQKNVKKTAGDVKADNVE